MKNISTPILESNFGGEIDIINDHGIHCKTAEEAFVDVARERERRESTLTDDYCEISFKKYEEAN
jgi:hypothetical protein